jgi:hypothetical protein
MQDLRAISPAGGLSPSQGTFAYIKTGPPAGEPKGPSRASGPEAGIKPSEAPIGTDKDLSEDISRFILRLVGFPIIKSFAH